MRTANRVTPPFTSLRDGLNQLLRPAVGFQCPDDVIKDPDLTADEKRAILSSWASDACAVEGRPDLRWMLGTDEPVGLYEIVDALERLDRREQWANSRDRAAECSITQ
ncbi:MAG: hypothetical protein Q7T61_16825 [Caulobacter sp.]|nr:hypothetical protein [Caulobacter sp.]